MLTQITIISGIIVSLGVLATGIRWVVSGIVKISRGFDNLELIMTNHLPHIYQELKFMREDLHEIRKNSSSDSGGDWGDSGGIESQFN